MSETKLHDAVKPFDHKPEKRGADGKIVSARYYGTHIVNGTNYHYFYDEPDKFYHTTGEPIPFEQVPDVCKKNIKKIAAPKPNDTAIIKSKKSGEPESNSSLI
jgi:hypothetical protein